jgi:hypothetical protein
LIDRCNNGTVTRDTASVHHCKKNWSKIKSLFIIPITLTVFSISVEQNFCSSPLSFYKITQVGKKTLTLLMETNPIPGSKKYFRCICLNSVGTALSVSRIFSISPPLRTKQLSFILKCIVNTTKYTEPECKTFKEPKNLFQGISAASLYVVCKHSTDEV